MKAPRPVGISAVEAKELQQYMSHQSLDRNRWPALARLLERLDEDTESNEPVIAFHTEIG